jgi:hypothetical protein
MVQGYHQVKMRIGGNVAADEATLRFIRWQRSKSARLRLSVRRSLPPVPYQFRNGKGPHWGRTSDCIRTLVAEVCQLEHRLAG